MIRFGNRPPLIRRSVPAHKSHNIESNLNRLGFFNEKSERLEVFLRRNQNAPRPSEHPTVKGEKLLSFSARKRTNHAPITFDQQAQVSQGHKSYRNMEIEIPRFMVVEALSWRSRRAGQHPTVQSPVYP